MQRRLNILSPFNSRAILGRQFSASASTKDGATPFIRLVKKQKVGSPMVWEVFLDAENRARIVWGRDDGKKQEITRTVENGKQKRSVREQIEFEAKSMARRKIQKDGYHLDIGSISDTSDNNGETERVGNMNDAELPPLPMLARTYAGKEKLKSDFIYVQPKLDGLRCLADLNTGRLWSRARKGFEGLDHISDAIMTSRARTMLLDQGVRYIDGEIYKHGLHFQDITSRARRLQENRHKGIEELMLHVFDVCLFDSPFERRWSVLSDAFTELNSKGPVILCATERYQTESFKPDEVNNKWTSEGYEGMMIRLSPNNGGGYDPGIRSNTIFKYKTFMQEEYEVLEFLKHRELDTLGSVLLKLPSGETFSAAPASDSATKREMWESRAVYQQSGWRATVQFQELSRTGVPRFPVLVGFRHEDDQGA